MSGKSRQTSNSYNPKPRTRTSARVTTATFMLTSQDHSVSYLLLTPPPPPPSCVCCFVCCCLFACLFVCLFVCCLFVCCCFLLFFVFVFLLPLTFDNNFPSCHRKCVCNYYLSIGNTQINIGNTQISVLLLCFLYLFVELMITMYEYILFKPALIA